MNGFAEDVVDGVALHSVPCRIRVDGGVRNAAVNSYFMSSIRSQKSELTASLRGRPLMGIQLQIPTGYAGVVLKRSGPDDSVQNETSCEMSVSDRVSSLHYWTLGSKPSSQHRLPQAVSWTHIAQSLHTPLSVEDN